MWRIYQLYGLEMFSVNEKLVHNTTKKHASTIMVGCLKCTKNFIITSSCCGRPESQIIQKKKLFYKFRHVSDADTDAETSHPPSAACTAVSLHS